MGIFSDVEDYTVDELQQIALELYNRAYREHAGQAAPDQVKLLAEWAAVNAFRRKMRINSHKITVPRSLLPVELLNKQRELDELKAHAAIGQPRAVRPRVERLPKYNVPRPAWVQAVQEPVANPFVVAVANDPF